MGSIGIWRQINLNHYWMIVHYGYIWLTYGYIWSEIFSCIYRYRPRIQSCPHFNNSKFRRYYKAWRRDSRESITINWFIYFLLPGRYCLTSGGPMKIAFFILTVLFIKSTFAASKPASDWHHLEAFLWSQRTCLRSCCREKFSDSWLRHLSFSSQHFDDRNELLLARSLHLPLRPRAGNWWSFD